MPPEQEPQTGQLTAYRFTAFAGKPNRPQSGLVTQDGGDPPDEQDTSKTGKTVPSDDD